MVSDNALHALSDNALHALSDSALPSGYTGVLQNVNNTWKATKDTHPQPILKNYNISNIVLISPSVRSLTIADYDCANPLTPNTTVSAPGISPKRDLLRLRIWHQSSHLVCNSTQKIKQTANFAFYTPDKNPESQHKVLSINT